MGLGIKSTHFQGAFMSFCDDAGASRDSDSSVPFCHRLLQCSVPCSKHSRKTLPHLSSMPRGSSGTGNPLRKWIQSCSCLLGGLLHGGRGLWNVGDEESGLDISAPLKWGRIFKLWCQQLLGPIHKAMKMVTRNQDEWFFKDMKYISNEPFSSLFSARTIFFPSSSCKEFK